MKAARLTHGGFYRHFSSKEALFAAAFGHAVGEILSAVKAAPTDPKHPATRDQYIASYLAAGHVEDRGQGCPLAAIGAEIANLHGTAEIESSDTVERMARLITPEKSHATKQGFATMALLLGTITLARLAKTPKLSKMVLDAGERGTHLLECQWQD